MTLKSVFDHFLVPKHQIVPREKIDELLKELGTDLAHLPKILSNDPAVLEIGAKKGDVIKIIRKSKTAGVAIYYRVVV